MKWKKQKWGEDVGSIDFMQVVIGLLIVGVACVGTFQALEYGNDQLNYQMRYRKAMSIARSSVEYWQGRIHTDYPDEREMAGNINRGEESILDKMDPRTDVDDIYCNVSYGVIVPMRNVELGVDRSGNPLVTHFVIRSRVTWMEPGQSPTTPPHEVTFQGSMVTAAL